MIQPDFTLTCQQIDWPTHTLRVCIPDETSLQRWWHQQPEGAMFPYWAKIWPAAHALCSFLLQHPHWITGKDIIEPAAGLALPSLLAASFARRVQCSDIAPEAVWVVQQSIRENALQNISCITCHWNQLQPSPDNEVLLLSDINYEAAHFEDLFILLKKYLDNHTSIILSTPQRLMAKPFIEKLLPYCSQQQEIAVGPPEQAVYTTVLVLQQQLNE